MSADRELLEAAAKAYGIVNGVYVDKSGPFPPCIQYTDENDCLVSWTSLDDDGDALRLAVTFCLRVHVFGQGMCEVTCPERSLAAVFEAHSAGDTGAATRRAIVMAAAAIGGAA